MKDLQVPEKKRNFESRRATRNNVFNIIFQIEFFSIDQVKSIINKYYETLEYEEELEIQEKDTFIPSLINREIIERQVFDIVQKLAQIDEKINSFSIGWDIDRLDKVDLAVLRLAVYEIIFDKNVPSKVAINEAIELAKEYSSEKSYRFINAILAKIQKEN